MWTGDDTRLVTYALIAIFTVVGLVVVLKLHWSAVPRGAYVGLMRHHHCGHLVRAAVEGV